MLKLRNVVFENHMPNLNLMPLICFKKDRAVATKDWKCFEMLKANLVEHLTINQVNWQQFCNVIRCKIFLKQRWGGVRHSVKTALGNNATISDECFST